MKKSKQLSETNLSKLFEQEIVPIVNESVEIKEPHLIASRDLSCSVIECVKHKECGIILITNKKPKTKYQCSYFKNFKDQEKFNKKKRMLCEDDDQPKRNVKVKGTM